jgi:hypothetical protein
MNNTNHLSSHTMARIPLINQLILTAIGYKFDCIRLVSVDGDEEHVHPGDSFIDYTRCGMKNDDTSMEAVPADVKELTQSKEALVENMQTIIHFFLD